MYVEKPHPYGFLQAIFEIVDKAQGCKRSPA